MKKIILLTTALLSSVSVYGACNSTLDLGCRCQHPIINSEGKLACGEDYCAKVGKKCMSDGTCCESDKYCEVTKECCSENQTCDTISGCVENNTCSSDTDCASNLCNTSTGKCCPQIDGLPETIVLYENKNAGIVIKSPLYNIYEGRCSLGISISAHFGVDEWCDCPIGDEVDQRFECLSQSCSNICERYGGNGVHECQAAYGFGAGCYASCYMD